MVDTQISMASVLEAINSISPVLRLTRRGSTQSEMDALKARLNLALPSVYEDFLSMFGAVPGLKLIGDAEFSVPTLLDALEDETFPRWLIPIAYDPSGMNPEFITLKCGLAAGVKNDDPEVYFTYADGLAKGHAGGLLSRSFTRFVVVGLAAWMVCPLFKYKSSFAPEIDLKYTQVCKVVDVDSLVLEGLSRLGYRPILASRLIPVFRRESDGYGVVVYNRCPGDYAFTLSIGADRCDVASSVRGVVEATLKCKLKEDG